MSRLLRYARQNPAPLAKNPAHNFSANHALVHYSSETIYSFIPKNACTTLRYSLALSNGAVSSPEDLAWIHANNMTFRASLRDLITAKYAFVIIRCPYARLSSVFLDKFVGYTPPAWNFRRLYGDKFELDNLSFRKFCSILQKNKKFLYGDIHWRPQVDFLVYEEYDDWFCLEEFEEAAEKIKNRSGLEVHDTRQLIEHHADRFALVDDNCYADWPVHRLAEMHRDGRSPSHKALYDSDIIERVSNMYKDDVELYQLKFRNGGLLFK